MFKQRDGRTLHDNIIIVHTKVVVVYIVERLLLVTRSRQRHGKNNSYNIIALQYNIISAKYNDDALDII